MLTHKGREIYEVQPVASTKIYLRIFNQVMHICYDKVSTKVNGEQEKTVQTNTNNNHRLRLEM